eukprot:g6684.t1
MMIFSLAQAAYAFLFTATWGKEWSSWHKILLFFLVLPFGQVVPFFTWLESFHFPCLNRRLQDLGLRPTDEVGTSSSIESRPATFDNLWAYIQKKYQAHAGFLAEAFVEAVPQCVLQIAAVTLSAKASTLNVLSITLSMCVITSKGYLIAYSIHCPTFVFNFLCLVADCIGLFATATWLFQPSVVTHVVADLNMAWIILALSGILLSITGGFFLLWVTILDDHVKVRSPAFPQVVMRDVWFSLYTLRLVSWGLAILPCCVLYMSAKLVSLPILLFRSLDPEHALHADFYKPLFSFLHADGDTDLRLKTVNVFLAQANGDIDSLRTLLNASSGSHLGTSEQRLLSWAEKVGTRKLAAMQHGMEGKLEDAKEDLSIKSAVISSLFEKHECFPSEEPSDDRLLRALRILTAICLVLTAFMDGPDGISFFLPQILSCTYLVVIGGLLCLVRSVGNFQLVRADVLGIKNFPAPFYSTTVIRVLEKRYRRELAKREMTVYMELLLSKDCARVVAKYCGDDFRFTMDGLDTDQERDESTLIDMINLQPLEQRETDVKHGSVQPTDNSVSAVAIERWRVVAR